jgi:hypothetical protein
MPNNICIATLVQKGMNHQGKIKKDLLSNAEARSEVTPIVPDVKSKRISYQLMHQRRDSKTKSGDDHSINYSTHRSFHER